MFNILLNLINECALGNFFDATEKLKHFIYSTEQFEGILAQIGTIPESIEHDSTEEKLFAKVSDIVLSRAFRELGLKSNVLSERADSADVFAQSPLHGYTLVADAKAFRLSRTAKNQKDFKVTALSGWKNDAEYAVLCSPYFHYPRVQSQIYAQALDKNVCLLSWEHIIFMIQHGIKEDEKLNLSSIWNFTETLSHKVVVADKKKSFMEEFSAHLLTTVGFNINEFDEVLSTCIRYLVERGEKEKEFWEEERKIILSYTHKQAISELIKSKKIDEKIRQIQKYIGGISRDR